MHRRHLIRSRNLLVAVTLWATLPAAAHADAGRAGGDGTRAEQRDYKLAASARVFFRQGIAFADKRQWADAADRFRRAMSIRKSPVIAFNLAVVLDELGQVVEAAELLHQVAEESPADSPMASSAQTLLPKVEAKFASLEITLSGPAEGTVTRLDGLPLAPVQIGAPIPVDPGEHELSVERDGRTTARKQVTTAVDSPATVTLGTVYVPSPEEVAQAEALRQSQQVPVQAPSVTERWWFWASVGAVTAGTVALAAVLTLGGGSGDHVSSQDNALQTGN